jgi:hypothetical protein
MQPNISAQSGHDYGARRCLFLEVKRTSADLATCPLMTQSGYLVGHSAPADFITRGSSRSADCS